MSQGSDEAEEIRRAQGGDSGALDALIQWHFRSVYNLALLLCGNEEDASAVVEETFVRMHRQLAAFHGDPGKFSTWLYRIETNAFLDQRKRRRPPLNSLDDIINLE